MKRVRANFWGINDQHISFRSHRVRLTVSAVPNNRADAEQSLFAAHRIEYRQQKKPQKRNKETKKRKKKTKR